MQGDPRHFESVGSRFGFQVEADTPEELRLVWRGSRFPAFLCLGISLALLFLSVPIAQAIALHGLASRVGSLWYFPVMNLVLFGVAIFLISLNRRVRVERKARLFSLSKGSLFGSRKLVAGANEIADLRLGTDAVYAGIGVAGTTQGQSYFPALSLRLRLIEGPTVLIDRAGTKRLENLAQCLSRALDKPIVREEGQTGLTSPHSS
jgi:hypothetical protein